MNNFTATFQGDGNNIAFLGQVEYSLQNGELYVGNDLILTAPDNGPIAEIRLLSDINSHTLP